MTPITTDVLVVGAGPAGSTAARFAAQHGARVLLVDKRHTIGVPVQCAEHVPVLALDYLNDPRDVVVQPVAAMRTHLDGTTHTLRSRGVIVRRDLFDQQLTAMAQAQGAELRLRTIATALHDGVMTLKSPDGPFQVRATVIIGADGPHSKVRAWSGGGATRFVQALQYRMRLCAPMTTTECYLRRYLPGGYGWVFPRGSEANVGVGVDPSLGTSVSEGQAQFVAELRSEGVIQGHILHRTGGAIPVGGMVHLRRGNVLLVGDAAGHCHPITGAGIGNALVCGELAGASAADAAISGNLDLLDEYAEEAAELVGPSLAQAVTRRQQMTATWWDDNPRWTTDIQKSWVAFDTYYEAGVPSAI